MTELPFKDVLISLLEPLLGRNELTVVEPINTQANTTLLKLQYGRQMLGFKYCVTQNNSPVLAEADGLNRLSEAGLVVPKTFWVGKYRNTDLFLREWVDTVPFTVDRWQLFGEQLAQCHRVTNPTFGYASTNYIGSLVQDNTPETDWITFFISRRLEAQLRLLPKTVMDSGLSKQFDRLFVKLEDIFPKEPPALVHGDLWQGNVIAGQTTMIVIDPAVYYGHREVDLSFSQLFGRFDRRFYEAYEQAYPLEPGFADRVDVYNLYPLLVHANLFGRSYLQDVRRILTYYIG